MVAYSKNMKRTVLKKKGLAISVCFSRTQYFLRIINIQLSFIEIVLGINIDSEIQA